MPALEGDEYESDGLDETILPLDYETAGMLRDDDLNAHLVQKVPRGAKLMAILDSCHSGTGLDLPHVWDGYTHSWKRERAKFSPPADITLLAGCRADQTSADVNFGGGYNAQSGGAMTLAFLSAICTRPFRQTYKSLMSQMMTSLRSRGFHQTVQLSSSLRFPIERRFG